MTNRHHDFDLTSRNHHITRCPGILDDTPIRFDSATLALTTTGRTLCEWDEPDIHAALNDFETADSFNIGLLWHIDVMQAHDQIYVAIWHADTPGRPLHTVELREDFYYARLAVARTVITAQAANVVG